MTNSSTKLKDNDQILDGVACKSIAGGWRAYHSGGGCKTCEGMWNRPSNLGIPMRRFVNTKVARENLQTAGLASKVTVIQGPGYDSLTKLHPDAPFDLIFIDADKPSNVKYFTEAKRLVRKGGIIVRLSCAVNSMMYNNEPLLQIVDNVVRYGRVADPSYTDANVEGVRELLKAIQGDKDVEATTIGTAGDKGYDGFLYAIRK